MCSTTSWLQKTKSSSRRCSRFSSELVSRLSTQSTRKPLPSRYSQRWEPRNPAPPVTTAVAIQGMLSASQAGSRRSRPALRSPYAVSWHSQASRLLSPLLAAPTKGEITVAADFAAQLKEEARPFLEQGEEIVASIVA